MSHFELEDSYPDQAKIKVVGVGGAGGNAINNMIQQGIPGVEFIAANTDVQALEKNLAPIRLQLGGEMTRGLGAGANPDKGREAALESVADLKEVLQGADMVFVTAGMGGGTGTGAAPIVAQVAREAGALTVGVVTRPFRFEGKRRARMADQGIEHLEGAVDTLITIANQRLLDVTSDRTSIQDAFKTADEVLLHATAGVSNLITVPGLINVDFADVRTIMHEQGRALMGMGIASDEGRAQAATLQAINSPLLGDMRIRGAKGILLNITAGPDLRLHEVEEAASMVQEEAHEDCNIIFGAVIDESMGDTIQITVIATGFDTQEEAQEAVPQGRSGILRRRRRTEPPAAQAGGDEPRPYRHQPRLFTPGTLAASSGGVPSASGTYAGAPAASAPASSAPAASASAPSTAGWPSVEPPADPSEIPAYMRRREDGTYVR